MIEKFREKITQLIPVSKNDWKIIRAFNTIQRLVENKIFTWDEVFSSLQVRKQKSYYISKAIAEKYFIINFGRHQGVKYFLLLPRKPKKLNLENSIKILASNVKSFYFDKKEQHYNLGIEKLAKSIVEKTEKILIRKGLVYVPYNENTKELLKSEMFHDLIIKEGQIFIVLKVK